MTRRPTLEPARRAALLRVVAAALLLATLTACSSSSTTKSTTDAEPGTSVTTAVHATVFTTLSPAGIRAQFIADATTRCQQMHDDITAATQAIAPGGVMSSDQSVAVLGSNAAITIATVGDLRTLTQAPGDEAEVQSFLDDLEQLNRDDAAAVEAFHAGDTAAFGNLTAQREARIERVNSRLTDYGLDTCTMTQPGEG